VQPGLAEAERLLAAGDYQALPIWLTLPAGTRDPLELFCALRQLSRHCYIFESLEDAADTGRYTILGFDPKLEISCTDGRLRIVNGATLEFTTSDPSEHIQGILAEYKSPRLAGLPPFTGGLVGYFAYDYITYSEPVLRLEAADSEGFKDFDLMLFDKVLAYDHLEQRLYLIATIKADGLAENYQRAARELDDLARLVVASPAPTPPPLQLAGPFEPLFSAGEYCAMVERAQHYIHEGDIFQVVLANRLSAPAEGSLFATYQALRRLNPSPYLFYLSSEDIELAGASPETLVRLQDGEVMTYPLAGTRPRGATAEEDAALAADLLADAKELAEHNMLVDLGRNDVGRVSSFGSVQVTSYLALLRFSHVMHIGSTVCGQLAEGRSATDVIAAILPAGTLSGAPKVRACQIINELEGTRRGVYGGAIGYLSFTGDMDTCIAIRLAFKKNGQVFVRSGAGIVADSIPANEHQECLNKMQAVLAALDAASGDAAGGDTTGVGELAAAAAIAAAPAVDAAVAIAVARPDVVGEEASQ
jgi:anthranilate synthase component 1